VDVVIVEKAEGREEEEALRRMNRRPRRRKILC